MVENCCDSCAHNKIKSALWLHSGFELEENRLAFLPLKLCLSYSRMCLFASCVHATAENKRLYLNPNPYCMVFFLHAVLVHVHKLLLLRWETNWQSNWRFQVSPSRYIQSEKSHLEAISASNAIAWRPCKAHPSHHKSFPFEQGCRPSLLAPCTQTCLPDQPLQEKCLPQVQGYLQHKKLKTWTGGMHADSTNDNHTDLKSASCYTT